MRTCFDTSALFKLIVQEVDSTVVERIWRAADDPTTSVVGYAELRASVTRATRAGRLAAMDRATAQVAVERVWGEIVSVNVDLRLARAAGRLAERHALKSLGAIHLASALSLREPGGEVVLVTFDGRQREAALAEGMTVLPEAV